MSMLKGNKLLYKFWGETVSVVVYTLNLNPTKRFAEKTLEEVWSDKKPNVLGLICFRHVFTHKKTR